MSRKTWFRILRVRHGDLATVATLARRIERTAASFGTDRLFDDRLGQIELDALTIRQHAEQGGVNAWHELRRFVASLPRGYYSDRAIRERRAEEKRCVCPSHASNRGECPIHDDKGRRRPPMNVYRHVQATTATALTAEQWREAWMLAAPVVVAANRYVEAEADGAPSLIADAHTQLLRALTDYKNGGKA